MSTVLLFSGGNTLLSAPVMMSKLSFPFSVLSIPYPINLQISKISKTSQKREQNQSIKITQKNNTLMQDDILFVYYFQKKSYLFMLIRLVRRGSGVGNKYWKGYLLKNGKVVNSDMSETTDVLIEDEVVTAIGRDLSHSSAEVIDCSGKMIIPGGIDTHTHMQLPFMGTHAIDDFDSGTKAALAGGTTSFIDFAIPTKQETLSVAYDRWRGWADPKVNCDYALHAAVTSWNENTKDEMKKMVERGIQSFKFFMAYNGVLRLDDISMYKAFETARDLGAICIVHAENGDLVQLNTERLLDMGITGPEGHYLSRKENVEAEAVHRVITYAENTNVPLYIVHLMSRESTEEVMRARNRGSLVYGETLAATLGTDGTKLWDKDWDVASRYVMSPCLSPDPTTKTQIMKYLQSGVIDVVGTDNCTFCTEQKQLGKNGFNKIPNGVNGLEDRLSVVWTKGVRQGLLSENQFVDVTSSKAAKIFNLYPKKGIIKVGADADVVVWDPESKKTISCKHHHQKVDYNVFEGMEVYGKACYTFSRGNLVWDGSKFLNQQKGKYMPRKPFGYVYGRHAAWTQVNNPLNRKVDRSKKENTSDSSELDKLRQELESTRKERDELLQKVKNSKVEENKYYDKQGQLIDPYLAMRSYLPDKIFQDVRQIFFGGKAEEITLKSTTLEQSNNFDVEVKHFRINSEKQETRAERRVKVAAIQNKIVLPTSQPVQKQKQAIMDRIKQIIEISALEGVNIVALQEIWNAPFFMCTRERYPWVQFSEPYDGESTQFLSKLAKKHNMVIISSILEREKDKGTLHNTAVVIDNHGDILGKQVKGHIPRVGDFNESTYYMEGESGHPVFDTEFGKLAINICYGRHHPLHWMGFGLNGAEIVFNPSATVNGLSEPLWGIEARNAAIANHYYSVGINRVGTEVYPNQFTSGDKKAPKRQFGHFYGSTYVTAPDGSRTPPLSRTRDGVLITDMDLNLCQQIKDKWLFTMTGRHKLYADLLQHYISDHFSPQIIRKQ